MILLYTRLLVTYNSGMEKKVVIAVTRAGRGDWYLFDSFEEADEHPIVQYGDAIMTHPTHFMTQFTRLEMPWLLDLLDMGHIPRDRDGLERNSGVIWARMQGRASRPPESPDRICEIIRRDRQLSKKEKPAMAEEKTKEKKMPAPPKREKKYAGDSVITLLTNDEGVPYGKENNPKRPGTKTHAAFAKYRNGMTVDQAVADGIDYGTIVYDVDKGFISVKPK